MGHEARAGAVGADKIGTDITREVRGGRDHVDAARGR